MVQESTTLWQWAHQVGFGAHFSLQGVSSGRGRGGSPLHGRNQHRATTISTTMGNPGHPGKLIYVCYCAIRKHFTLTGIPSEIKKKRLLFLISYLATPIPTSTLNSMLNKRNYTLKMILGHHNLATNARVNLS